MVTTLSVWIAHALAWAAGVWLAFWPSYRGVSVTSGGETTRHTKTFFEVNGFDALWVPVVPIMLTGIGLLVTRLTQKGEMRRKVLLWSLVVLLSGYCALAVCPRNTGRRVFGGIMSAVQQRGVADEQELPSV